VLRTIFEQDHHDFRSVVRAFVERSIMSGREQARRDGRFSRDVWLEAGRQGLLGLCIPERYGGAGVNDYRFNAVLDEELTRAGLAYAAAIGVHVHVIAPYLVERTTEEQRRRWLPGMASGELVTAIAMTEPGGGSDFANLRTRAVRDGSEWVINGSKTFITNGATADLIVVAARTSDEPGARGISLICVEGNPPGLTRGQPLKKVGLLESDTAELFFDHVRVPATNLLGEEGKGFAYAMEHLAQERLASAVCNVSHARYMLESTIEYVKQREAFGGPLGALQHIRFVIAELATEIDAAQALVDAAIQAHCAGRLDPVDAAKAKLKSSEVQNAVADACLQLHGGHGYILETPISRDWQDARVTRIWAGTNEIMREVIGRSLGLVPARRREQT
jgi:alkylation response protein AidB-like acyl-CoA dehydrogenase